MGNIIIKKITTTVKTVFFKHIKKESATTDNQKTKKDF